MTQFGEVFRDKKEGGHGATLEVAWISLIRGDELLADAFGVRFFLGNLIVMGAIA